MKIKYPKGEHIEVTYSDVNSVPQYLITRERKGIGKYILYKINSEGITTKIKTGKDPQFVEVNQKLKGGVN